MAFQRKQVASALAAVLGGGALVAAAPATAQDIRVEVTGSMIRRVEAESALPVQVITRDAIEAQGIQTAAAVVERLSSNSSIGGLSLSGGIGGTNVGYASASLRGLGSSRTLVLLNGRRLANTAFSGTTVDINSIPLSAIDRVEVLTDGASALYGSDAIAGVINFILRREFTGVEAYASYGDTQQGGGQTQRYSVTAGWGNLDTDKFNVWGTVDYNKVDAIAAAERDYSRTAYLANAPGGTFDRTSGNSIPGNVFIPGVGTGNPNNPTCLPPYSFPTTGSPAQCRFDYASVIDIVPPSDSWNVLGGFRWQFAKDHQFFLEGSWSQTESTSRISPGPISSATLLSGDPVLTVPGSPFYPTAYAQQNGVNGQPLEVFWRSLELGPRTDVNTIKQWRVVAGLQGVIGGWDYSTAFNYSKSDATDEWPSGWAYGSQLLPILNSGRINLFGLNSDAALSELRSAQATGPVIDASGTMYEIDGKVSRDVYNLPAGPLGLAIGGTWRKEEYVYNSSAALQSGDIPGLGGSIASTPEVSRDMWALYAEANIPIVKGVEVSAAIRYDDYEDIGSTWNPKIGLRWQPSRELLLRGAWGTGFRAPGLPELFSPNSFSATGDNYDDPLRCPSTGSPRDCNAQFTTQIGGNPQLSAEESTNWTVGFIWEPVREFSFGVEYWNIKVDNVIGTPAEEPLFTNMVESEALGLLFRYEPGSGGCQNAGSPPLPCPVNYGVQNNVNLSTLETSGLDINLNYRSPTTSFGSFNAYLTGTYYFEWTQQAKGEEPVELIGRYGGGIAATVAGLGSTGAFPRWKHNVGLGWAYGPWGANVDQVFVKDYLDAGGTRRVDNWSMWNLTGAYNGFKNWTLQAGVKNLLNSDPPYTRQSQSFQVGYDPAIADPFGRFWWIAVRYKFDWIK